MNVLLIRYNINSSLVLISGKSRIYIASTESAKITNLVLVALGAYSSKYAI